MEIDPAGGGLWLKQAKLRHLGHFRPSHHKPIQPAMTKSDLTEQLREAAIAGPVVGLGQSLLLLKTARAIEALQNSEDGRPAEPVIDMQPFLPPPTAVIDPAKREFLAKVGSEKP